jgi:hypothetical protein
MTNKIIQAVERIARRFFSAPFENLPPEYGDPVPPELRVFEAEAEASQREAHQEIAVPGVHDRRSQPARPDESLERE